MLDAISGILLRSDEDWAVVDVNGLQFRAEIPASTARQLPAPGQKATLLTRLSLNTNEGTFQLFGFATEMERDCFDIFTTITGIGPRKGLMILSQIEIPPFAKAIITNDIKYLSKIKGVGTKTAERMVLELREKMVPYSQQAPSGATGAVTLPGGDNVRDAVEALMVLGCRPAVAEKAVGEAVKELGESAGTEALIRVALKHR
ncbi:Holliday junction branch migration protein RuvA [bacterium]|nr:Holliday junction branch migration protein RuvA [bacterium]